MCSKIKVFSFLLCLLLLGGLTSAFLPVPIGGQVQSKIRFKIRNAEILANGSFDKIETKIVFDKDTPGNIQFVSNIDVNSISTGIRLRDKHLKSEKYFDLAKFPNIELRLIKATLLQKDYYEGNFSIKMKGMEKQMLIPFSVKEENGSCYFKAQFQINRSDYKIGGKSWTLAELADISVEFKLDKIGL